MTEPNTLHHAAFELRSFGMTHCGKLRSRNEDQFLIANLTKAMHVWQSSLPQPDTRLGEEQAYLFMVADGIGGHQAGDKASALTVDAVEEFVLNTFQWFFHLDGTEGTKVLNEFKTAFRQTDARLCELASHRPEWRGMGTTLTLAYLQGTKLLVAHVGDSRCYLLRQGKMIQLTQDHTVVAELQRRGILDTDRAQAHEYRHVMTNAMGGSQLGVEVESRQLDLKPDDVLMLCSDGLTDMVPIQTVCNLLHAEKDARQACEKLVQLANDNGGKDNITVIVVRCDALETRMEY